MNNGYTSGTDHVDCINTHASEVEGCFINTVGYLDPWGHMTTWTPRDVTYVDQKNQVIPE